MNKKFLSAVLFGAFMLGTSVTFTGCIDNDEPAGIEELRGAKAELIKAKAAVELANEAWVRAQVAHQELVNKAKEIENRYKEIDVQIHEYDVKIKEAATAAEVAKYEQQKQYWENQKALEAERFKADMLDAQAATAQAQLRYDNALKEIEAAKLLLSDGEKAIVDKAQGLLTAAANALSGKHDALVAAQNAFNNALVSKAAVTLSKLEADLAYNKAAVEVEVLKVAEKEEILALAKNFDAANWDAEMTKLNAKIQKAEMSRDSAEVEVVAVKVGEKYQAAQAALEEAVDALGEKEQKANTGEFNETTKKYVDIEFDDKTATASDETLKGAYLKAQADSLKHVGGTLGTVTEAGEDLKIAKYESNAIDDGLLSMFPTSMFGTSLQGNKLTYGEGTYRQNVYDKDLADETTVSVAAQRLATVEGWIEALADFTTDKNGEALAEIEIASLKKALETEKTGYNAVMATKKAAWDVAVLAKKGTATPVSTVEFAKAQKAYNDAFAAVSAAVTAYNTAYDGVYTTAYNNYITNTKNVEIADEYRKKLIAAVVATGVAEADAKGMSDAALEIKLNDTKKVADLKAAAAKTIDNNYASQKNSAGEELNATLIALLELAKAAGDKAINDDKALGADKSKMLIAEKNLNDAQTKEGEAKDAFATAYAAYKTLAKDYYAAEPTAAAVKAYTDKALYGEGTLVVADKDNAAKFAMGAKRTTISDAAFAAICPTQLNGYYVATALSNTTIELYGSRLEKVNGEPRIVPATRTDIINALTVAEEALGAKELAELIATVSEFGVFGQVEGTTDLIAYWEKVAAAADQVAPLQAEIEAALAALKAEIAANDALAVPFITAANEAWAAVLEGRQAVVEAEDAMDAIAAPAEAAVTKFSDYATSLSNIKANLQSQLDALNGATSASSTIKSAADIVAYWETEVAKAKKAVATAESYVAQIEELIAQYNAGEYNEAYQIELAKGKLERAQAAYDAALVEYNHALAQLNTVLETLMK